MDIANIARTEFFLQLAQGGTAIVANNRLKKTLVTEFSQSQAKSAFVAPRVFNLFEWAYKLFEEACFAGKIDIAMLPDKILSSLEQKIIFNRIIKKAEQSNPLLNYSEISQQALEALIICQENAIDFFQENKYFLSLELNRFLVWQRQYHSYCKQNGFTDQLSLLQQICENINKLNIPDKILIAGFTRINPLQKKLFSAMKVYSLEADKKCQKTERIVCNSIEQEIKSATLWAQEINQNQAKAKIAIIVPQLEQHHDLVKDIVKSKLYPDQSDLRLLDYRPIHNFSLGKALIDYELIAIALTWLEILLNPNTHEFATYSNLLTSRYCNFELEEDNSKAKFDWYFRENCRQQVSLKQFLNILYNYQTNSLWADKLKQVASDCLKLHNKKEKLDYWQGEIINIFNLIGLGNNLPATINKELFVALSTALATFGNMMPLFEAVTSSQVVNLIRLILQKQTFQFRSRYDAPIQIMGMLEASGQDFDFVWLMQADINTIPFKPRPNRILPLELQKQLQTPKSSAQQELIFAQEILASLQKSTNNLIYSHASFNQEGVRQLASSLIADFPLTINDYEIKSNVGATFELEQQLEEFGTALSTPCELKNGLSYFKAQAVCPLMAYAQYRLGAQLLPKPEDDFSKLVRGNILHQIFEQIAPLENPMQQCPSIITKIVNKYAREANINNKFAQLEVKRLIAIVSEWWQKFETPRSDYQLEQFEKRLKFEFSGLKLNLIVDRIDDIKGKKFLIDYKTSEVSLAPLSDFRLTEPQLPLYTMALESDNMEVLGLAFAQLIPAKCALKPCSSVLIIGENAKFDDQQWQEKKQQWQDKLTVLAQEIISGEVYLLTDYQDKMKYSPALGFCRINQEVT